MLPADFKITRAAIAGTPQQMRNERAEAQSFMRVVIEPQRAVQLDLDYSYEEQFKGCVATRFPSNAEAVSNDMAVEIDFRNRNAYLYKNLRNSPDIETVWAVMSCGATAFACTIGIPVGRLSWSLPDIAANIASTVRVANDVLMAGGYFGEVRMSVEVVPGGATLLMEGNSFAPILRKDFYPRPWPIVVPQYREKPVHLKGTANVTLNFNARFGQLGNFVSNVLNQLLRDMGFSPDLASIRSAVGNL
jgi:hypothetical protein